MIENIISMYDTYNTSVKTKLLERESEKPVSASVFYKKEVKTLINKMKNY